MKLIDYIEKENAKIHINSKQIEYHKQNFYLCEVHQIDLEVGDGFELVGCDLQYIIDSDFMRENPNSVWFDQSWERSKGFPTKECKIIFCNECETNRIKRFKETHPKKKKGQKSKKYQTKD